MSSLVVNNGLIDTVRQCSLLVVHHESRFGPLNILHDFCFKKKKKAIFPVARDCIQAVLLFDRVGDLSCLETVQSQYQEGHSIVPNFYPMNPHHLPQISMAK